MNRTLSFFGKCVRRKDRFSMKLLAAFLIVGMLAGSISTSALAADEMAGGVAEEVTENVTDAEQPQETGTGEAAEQEKPEVAGTGEAAEQEKPEVAGTGEAAEQETPEETKPEESAPAEMLTYATTEEFMAAMDAVGYADDIESQIAAVNNCLNIYNRLSPEDQAANADAGAYIRNYAASMNAGNPDEGIETTALSVGHSFQVKVAKVYLGTSGNQETQYINVTCTYSTGHSSGNCQAPLKLFHPSNFGWSDGSDWLGYRKDQYGTWTANSSYNAKFYSWQSQTIMLTCTSGGDRAWDTIYLVYKDPTPEYTYTLNYNGNKPSEANGAVDNMPSSQSSGSITATTWSPTVSSKIPTLNGYRFLGWSLNAAGTGALYKAGDTVPGFDTTNRSKTLYAKWEKIVPNPAISVTKTVNGSAEKKPGDTVSFTITVKNSGNVDFKVVAVTDTLPDGLTFVSATGNPVVTTNPIIWVLNTVPAGSEYTFVVTATVDADAAGTLTNIASAKGQTEENAQPEDTDRAAVTVKTESTPTMNELKVEKTFAGLDAIPEDFSIVWKITHGTTGEVATKTLTKDNADSINGMTLTWSVPHFYKEGTNSIKHSVEITENCDVTGYTYVTTATSSLWTVNGHTMTRTIGGATRSTANIINTYTQITPPVITDNGQGISIEKTRVAINGDASATTAKAGDTITWDIIVTNESNVEKTVTLIEQLAGATLSKDSVTLQAGQFETVTATYVVTGNESLPGNDTLYNTITATTGGPGDKENPKDTDEGTKIIKTTAPELTGITKTLESVSVNGGTSITDLSGLKVNKDDTIVLTYKITVTGDKDAEYIVSDPDATLAEGSSWTGILGADGKAEITVTKTVKVTESDAVLGILTVTNKAYVKPGDNTDPVPDDPSNPEDHEKGHPSNEVKTEIPVTAITTDDGKGISIEKTRVAVNGDASATTARAGDTITWNIVVTNNSNVEKTVTLIEQLAGATLSKDSVTLEAGKSETVTATYVVKDSDADKTLVNTVIGKTSPDDPGKEGKDSGTEIEAKVYTVTYTDGVDGEEVFEDQTTSGLKAGEKTPEFKGTPTREGYEFTGWSPEVMETVTGNAIYVAQWKEKSGTDPEDPAPENPTPEDPTPENPTPEDPTPENPTPEDPTPEDPTPENPTPEDPAPVIPAAVPVEPTVVPPTVPEEEPEVEIEENTLPLAEPEQLEEEEIVIPAAEMEIGDEELPLAEGQGRSWALVNFALMNLAIFESLMLLIGYFVNTKKASEEEEEKKLKKKGIMRLISLPVAIISIIAFCLTEDITLPTGFVDRWTILMVIIAVVQTAVVAFSRKKEEDEEEKARA